MTASDRDLANSARREALDALAAEMTGEAELARRQAADLPEAADVETEAQQVCALDLARRLAETLRDAGFALEPGEGGRLFGSHPSGVGLVITVGLAR